MGAMSVKYKQKILKMTVIPYRFGWWDSDCKKEDIHIWIHSKNLFVHQLFSQKSFCRNYGDEGVWVSAKLNTDRVWLFRHRWKIKHVKDKYTEWQIPGSRGEAVNICSSWHQDFCQHSLWLWDSWVENEKSEPKIIESKMLAKIQLNHITKRRVRKNA